MEIDAGAVVLQTSGVFSTAPINVNVATLQIANISVGDTITLRNGSTLIGTGTAQTTGAVSLPAAAAVTIASGANAADALTLGGGVSGASGTSINISGSGKVVLNQPSSYAGAWTINSGTLQVVNETALGSAAVTVPSGGALEVNNGNSNTFTITNAVNLSNGGTLRRQREQRPPQRHYHGRPRRCRLPHSAAGLHVFRRGRQSAHRRSRRDTHRPGPRKCPDSFFERLCRGLASQRRRHPVDLQFIVFGHGRVASPHERPADSRRRRVAQPRPEP